MTQEINIEDYRIPASETMHLDKRPTRVEAFYSSKEDYKEQLREKVEALSDLQRVHYAANRYALLLIFQGMDAAGKDSAIRNVLSGVNPQGCQVHSFKQPSAEELQHDFLWRTTKRLPERGKIGVFNRSYYEEVLIIRVHPELLTHQGIPKTAADSEAFWRDRYRSIVEHEAHLHRNGTRIVKFFLHVSKEEQAERFRDRIDEPDKNWKFNMGDIRERKLWPEYQSAYEACLSATSTEDSPWYVIPADSKKNARLIIAQTLIDTLNTLDLKYPEVSEERRQELLAIRDAL